MLCIFLMGPCKSKNSDFLTCSSVCKVSLNSLSSPLADLNISHDTNVMFLAKMELFLNMSL